MRKQRVTLVSDAVLYCFMHAGRHSQARSRSFGEHELMLYCSTVIFYFSAIVLML